MNSPTTESTRKVTLRDIFYQMNVQTNTSASPTFNANQFGNSATTTNIRTGALVTNMVFQDALIPSSSMRITNGSAFFGTTDPAHFTDQSNLWEYVYLPNTNDWNLFIAGGANQNKIGRIYYQAQHGSANGTKPEFSITMNGTMAFGWNQDSIVGAFDTQRGLQIGVGGNHREYMYLQGEQLLYDAANGHFGSLPLLFRANYTNGNGNAYSMGQTGHDVNNGDSYPSIIAHTTDLIGNGFLSVYDYFDVTAPSGTTWGSTFSERWRWRMGPTTPGATLFGTLDITNITDITGTNLWSYNPSTKTQNFYKDMHWYDRQNRSVAVITADAGFMGFFDGPGVFGNFSIYDGTGTVSDSHAIFECGGGANGIWLNPFLVGGIPGVSIGKSQNATNSVLEVNGSSEATIVAAKNGFLITSNTFPITANFGNRPGSWCMEWMSNATLYVICTNAINGNATTNKLGGL